MREACDREIKIPGDLSIIGFDDIRLAQFTTPPLTTAQMSQTELARLAFEAFLNEVKQKSGHPNNAKYRLVTTWRSEVLVPWLLSDFEAERFGLAL